MAKNDTKLETKIRTRDEVLADLKSLIRRPGYIYSLCIILFNDFHLSLEELGTINNREKLSIKEVALILGYLIQEKIDLTYPETTEYLIENKNQTYELLEELHFTFMVPQREMLAEILNKGSMAATPFTKFEFFTKKGSMQESIFYAGDGAYDLQYIEYLPQKYGLDQQWLKENRDFDFNEVSKIINSIRQIQQKKVNKTKHVNLRNPEFVESIKKYIKGRNKDKKLKETLALMEFMQFYHLFPQVPEDSGLTYSELEELYQSKWNIFYDNLLDLFILDYTKLSDLDGIDSFFTNFGVISPEQNKDFKTVGDYNILNSRPIIHLPDGRWFLPLYYLLAEAVYESPFYWMCEDKEYIRKALHNRGKVGEDIVYNLLKPVFGNNNIFQSVKIKTSREKTATDIDILCLLGNKALCVQVKSKKMTIAARRGELEALVKDFKLFLTFVVFHSLAKAELIGRDGHKPSLRKLKSICAPGIDIGTHISVFSSDAVRSVVDYDRTRSSLHFDILGQYYYRIRPLVAKNVIFDFYMCKAVAFVSVKLFKSRLGGRQRSRRASEVFLDPLFDPRTDAFPLVPCRIFKYQIVYHYNSPKSVFISTLYSTYDLKSIFI